MEPERRPEGDDGEREREGVLNSATDRFGGRHFHESKGRVGQAKNYCVLLASGSCLSNA
jgi:hypothetical protein